MDREKSAGTRRAVSNTRGRELDTRFDPAPGQQGVDGRCRTLAEEGWTHDRGTRLVSKESLGSVRHTQKSARLTDRYGSPFENNYFTEMCSGSEAGSFLRVIVFVYHSTLGLRVIKKKKKK